MKSIHIAYPGKHISKSGEQVELTESLLKGMVASYNPAKHKALIVLGHGATERDPCYGQVGKLEYRDGVGVVAIPDTVDAEFSDQVKAGRYPNVSMEVYPPDNKYNPMPGSFYLSRIAYLGAQPSAIKGLRPTEFSEAVEGCLTIQFSEMSYHAHSVAILARNLREWLLDKFDAEAADRVAPSYLVSELEEQSIKLYKDEDPMTQQQANFSEKEAELAARESQLAQREAAVAARAAADRRARHLQFAESVCGKTLAAENKPAIVAILDRLDGDEPILFGEGDDAKPLVDVFRDLLAGLPDMVSFGEFASRDRAGGPSAPVHFSAPSGYGVDQEGLALHQRAVVWRTQHPESSYEQAIAAVRQAN